MKIALSDTARIVEALAAANGMATAFTVCSASEIAAIANEAEKRLANHGVTLKRRIGCTLSYQPAGPIAQSYGHRAKSTFLELYRGSAQWFIIKIESTFVYPTVKRQFTLTVTSEAKVDILSHAMAGFRSPTPDAKSGCDQSEEKLVDA